MKKYAVKKYLSSVKKITKCFIFYFLELFSRKKKDCVTVFLRNGKPDSDTVPLLEFIEECISPRCIFLVTNKVEITEKYAVFFEEASPKSNVKIVHVKKRVQSILFSSHVFLKNGMSDAPELRCSRKKRAVLFIDHGLVTKIATSHHPLDAYQPLHANKSKKISGLRVSQGYVHACSMLATSKKLNTEQVVPIGYPRFYRAIELLQENKKPIVCRSFHDQMCNTRGMKILWAPTHPPSPQKPIFLPFSDFDSDEFNDFCIKSDVSFFVKTHAVNESYEVNGTHALNRLYTLTDDIAPGAIEIIPYFDIVVTDWSSIMMEAIALNVPVIHTVPKNTQPPIKFERSVALPGRVVSNTSDLYREIASIMRGKMNEDFVTKRFWNLTPSNKMKDAYGKVLLNTDFCETRLGLRQIPPH